MGKAYDGKKRWNETILATTTQVFAAGSQHHAAKKRLSERTHKLSAAMKRVDDETRTEVRTARLDALEADNFGEDVDEGDGIHDEAYVNEDDDGAVPALGGREPVKKKRRFAMLRKTKWKVKSLAQLVFEELGNGDIVEGPNYLTAAMGPPTYPVRRFCCVCGFFSNYNCLRCGSKYCSVGCGDQHKESGCMKFGL